MTHKWFFFVLVSACVELTVWFGTCGIDPFLKGDVVVRSAQETSTSNSLSFKALSNALTLATSIIDERCLRYSAFERVFPMGSGTNRFLRYGMGDECVRGLVNYVSETLDPAVREDALKTLMSELKSNIEQTDLMWDYSRKTRAEMIAWLSPEQMRKWFVLSANRKALFYKLFEERMITVNRMRTVCGFESGESARPCP